MNLLFQSDSITDCGRDRTQTQPNLNLGEGYVNLIAARLCFENPGFNVYNRGVSGNRTCDMYSRCFEYRL